MTVVFRTSGFALPKEWDEGGGSWETSATKKTGNKEAWRPIELAHYKYPGNISPQRQLLTNILSAL